MQILMKHLEKNDSVYQIEAASQINDIKGYCINIDDLCEIFKKTVGSLQGSSGMVLYTWVVCSHMSWRVSDWSWATKIAILWLALVILARLFMKINRRLVDGGNNFKLDTKTDTVMITGGSNGLGLLLTVMFSSNGFKTVNLDIQIPALSVANSQFIQCDVGDFEMVREAFDSLQSNVPSVLINCAGTVSTSLGDIQSIESDVVANVVDSNLMGTIWTTQQAIRRNPRLKMVVGLSSSTAPACPAYTSIYASSKAAVKAFYNSIRYELDYTRVLCVISGQLDTAMFANIKTPSQFWAPVIKSVDVASQIYDAVLAGRQGELYMPTYASLLPYVLVLPEGIVYILRKIFEIDLAAKPKRDQRQSKVH